MDIKVVPGHMLEESLGLDRTKLALMMISLLKTFTGKAVKDGLDAKVAIFEVVQEAVKEAQTPEELAWIMYKLGILVNETFPKAKY